MNAILSWHNHKAISTLQQASYRSRQRPEFQHLNSAIVSPNITCHTDGSILGEWGMRKWMPSAACKKSKKTNICFSEQSLRRNCDERWECQQPTSLCSIMEKMKLTFGRDAATKL
jgi:hypothetical protein